MNFGHCETDIVIKDLWAAILFQSKTHYLKKI